MVLENILKMAFGRSINIKYGSIEEQFKGIQIVTYVMLADTIMATYLYEANNGAPGPIEFFGPIGIAVTCFGTIIGASRWYYLSQIKKQTSCEK